MSAFDAQFYGPTFGPLLDTQRNRSLGEGEGDTAIWSQLSGLTTGVAFDHTSVKDEAMAAACLSGLWLLYDHLDDSHRVSQNLSTTSGSFWHGIMHRREGDFSNAKYWFRNVGNHDIFDSLSMAAERLATEHRAVGVLPTGDWDAMAFVDACHDAVQGNNDHVAFCRAVQQAEWELLFDYCYRNAII